MVVLRLAVGWLSAEPTTEPRERKGESRVTSESSTPNNRLDVRLPPRHIANNQFGPMRIYIESTIPSYVVARPARDLLQAARQQLTRDWWDLQREKHELFTSQVVLDEIAFGEKAMAQLRLETLQAVPLLQVTGDVKDLARKVLTSGLLPATSDRDATHIALASAYEMELLLSWNCRHIANAAIQARLRRLVEAAGFTLPVICTPEELLENDHEQND